MNKKKLIIPSVFGLTVLTAVASLGISNTFAYQGDYSQKGPDYSEERHEIMEKSFDENNYNNWKEQMTGRGRITEIVNEENFSLFAQAHKLGQEGRIAEADEIRRELGLRTSDGEKLGKGHGKSGGEGRGKGNGRNQGQNNGGNFVDKDGDGNCDNLK